MNRSLPPYCNCANSFSSAAPRLQFVAIDSTNSRRRKEQITPVSAVSARAKLKIMADKFTVGLVQMRCTKDAEENLTRAIGKVREAAARGAQDRKSTRLN